MEKEFVNYNQALKLKELGFDEPCLKTMLDFDITYESDVKMPLYQQAFRWFREKGYDVSFRKYDYGDESVFTGYYYTIYIGNETIDLHGADKRSKTYEGCELACLDKLLEIVESKSE